MQLNPQFQTFCPILNATYAADGSTVEYQDRDSGDAGGSFTPTSSAGADSVLVYMYILITLTQPDLYITSTLCIVGDSVRPGGNLVNFGARPGASNAAPAREQLPPHSNGNTSSQGWEGLHDEVGRYIPHGMVSRQCWLQPTSVPV